MLWSASSVAQLEELPVGTEIEVQLVPGMGALLFVKWVGLSIPPNNSNPTVTNVVVQPKSGHRLLSVRLSDVEKVTITQVIKP